MATKNEIMDIIFNCIEELNLQNGREIPKDFNGSLFGSKSDLDSLSLVHLIVNIEESINREYNLLISIVDERAMSQKNSPFRNVDTLADYIILLLNEK